MKTNKSKGADSVPLRSEILEYAKSEYGTDPEALFARYPTYLVLRHKSTGKAKGKWYAVIMDVKASGLGLDGDGKVEIINVKLDPDTVAFLKHAEGFLPAWHMSKKCWISIRLDGSVSSEIIKEHLDESFEITE